MTTNAITLTPQDSDRQAIVGATADQFARAGVFQDYQARRASNTLRRQQDDLAHQNLAGPVDRPKGENLWVQNAGEV